ncbi:MAG: GMC family oxidoreductase N-terminal domain-containing protein [Candidatus Limnocylindria bacterium]
MESDADFGDKPYHGMDGPIPIERVPRDEWGPADNALAEAALGLGYGWSEDHNAPTATGVSPFGLNARDGARVTTNDAYLEPARERANLRILGAALVDKVLVEAGRATGVRARVGVECIDVRARGVVVCAGAIHSPAILLRSGIGPEGPIAQLPVGEGMQEHPLALFWLFHRPEAVPEMDARQANCLLRYSSDLEGASGNDMMMATCNQTLALPENARSHLVMEDVGRPAGPGARRRGPVGGRRLRLPGGATGKHQPADHRSSRAAVGPHPRRRRSVRPHRSRERSQASRLVSPLERRQKTRTGLIVAPLAASATAVAMSSNS